MFTPVFGTACAGAIRLPGCEVDLLRTQLRRRRRPETHGRRGEAGEAAEAAPAATAGNSNSAQGWGDRAVWLPSIPKFARGYILLIAKNLW